MKPNEIHDEATQILLTKVCRLYRHHNNFFYITLLYSLHT